MASLNSVVRLALRFLAQLSQTAASQTKGTTLIRLSKNYHITRI